jgi:hypothetical protein
MNEHKFEPVAPWDLPEFYSRIRSNVLDLEEAYLSGSLCSSLDLNRLKRENLRLLYKTYASLVDRPPCRYPEIRRETIYALLDQCRLELIGASHFGTAQLSVSESLIDGKPRYYPLIDGTLNGEERRIRLDQLFDMRSWGVEFTFPTQSENAAFVSFVAAHSLARLRHAIMGIDKSLGNFQPKKQDGSIKLVPSIYGRRSEQLILDILNEDTRVAHRSTINDDFRAKTDLWVAIGSPRGRGSIAAQVTFQTNRVVYEEKLKSIRSLDRFAIISPVSLADLLLNQVTTEKCLEVLTPAERLEIWAELSTHLISSEHLADRIKSILSRAINSKHYGPLGPLSNVPRSIRRLICAFVEHEIRRIGQICDGTWPGPEPWWTDRPVSGLDAAVYKECKRVATRLRMARLSVGDVFTGQIDGITDYGVFVQVGDTAGLLHVSSLPPSSEPMMKRFSKGQHVTVRVDAIDLEDNRIALSPLEIGS